MMAEENINWLVVPEASESGGSSPGKSSEETPSSSKNRYSTLAHDHKASLGSNPDVESLRRNSSGEPISWEKKQKSVPHYLRASTGSCHDFCKYGQKHGSEVKERRPFRKRIAQASSQKKNVIVTETPGEKKRTTKALSDKQNPVSTAISAASVERKKSLLVKHEVSSNIKIYSVEQAASPDASHLADPPEIVKHEVFLHSENFEKQDPSSDKKTLKPDKSVSLPKRNPPVQLQLVKQSSSFPPKFDKKTPKAKKSSKSLSEKPTSRPQPIRTKSSSSIQKTEGSNGRGRRKDDIQTRKTMVASKPPSKKNLSPLTATLSATQSSFGRIMGIKTTKDRGLKHSSPAKDQKRRQKEELEEIKSNVVSERTLHVVETETKNSLPGSIEQSDDVLPLLAQSSPSVNLMPESKFSSFSSHGGKEEEEGAEGKEEEDISDEEEEEYDSDYDNVVDENDAKVIEGNKRKTMRKGGVILDSEDSLPVKLKFQRGRVVDSQSENNGPRRLRFRKGRVIQESHDCRNAMRRNFKKKGDNNCGTVTKPCDEKVVLRHQDTQEKKDAQGLFNNVIEETASKLVETRKNAN